MVLGVVIFVEVGLLVEYVVVLIDVLCLNMGVMWYCVDVKWWL